MATNPPDDFFSLVDQISIIPPIYYYLKWEKLDFFFQSVFNALLMHWLLFLCTCAEYILFISSLQFFWLIMIDFELTDVPMCAFRKQFCAKKAAMYYFQFWLVFYNFCMTH